MRRAGECTGDENVKVKVGSSKNHPLILNLGRNFDDEEKGICRELVSSHILFISGEGENL